MAKPDSDWPTYCPDSLTPKLHSVSVDDNSRRCGHCGRSNPFYLENSPAPTPSLKVEPPSQLPDPVEQSLRRRRSLGQQNRSNTIDLDLDDRSGYSKGSERLLLAAETLRQESIRKKPGKKGMGNRPHAGNVALSHRALGAGSISDPGLPKKIKISWSIKVVIMSEVFKLIGGSDIKEFLELKELTQQGLNRQSDALLHYYPPETATTYFVRKYVREEIANAQVAKVLTRAISDTSLGLDYCQFRLAKNVQKGVVTEFATTLDRVESIDALVSEFVQKPAGPIVYLIIPQRVADDNSDSELVYSKPLRCKIPSASSIQRSTRSKEMVKDEPGIKTEPGLMVGDVLASISKSQKPARKRSHSVFQSPPAIRSKADHDQQSAGNDDDSDSPLSSPPNSEKENGNDDEAYLDIFDGPSSRTRASRSELKD